MWDILRFLKSPEEETAQEKPLPQSTQAEKGKIGLDGVKIIMTTALSDISNIKESFREQCEAYLVKPIEKQKLINCLKELNIQE